MLNENLKNILEDMAYTIAEYINIEYPVVNIKEIVNKLGGSLLYNSNMSEFSDAVSIKNKDGSFRIEISPAISNERITYRVMEAICNLIIDKGLIVNDNIWRNQPCGVEFKLEDKYSESIKYLAKAILMPKRKFISTVYDNTKQERIDTSNIARIFCVPSDIAHKRGTDLNLIAVW